MRKKDIYCCSIRTQKQLGKVRPFISIRIGGFALVPELPEQLIRTTALGKLSKLQHNRLHTENKSNLGSNPVRLPFTTPSSMKLSLLLLWLLGDAKEQDELPEQQHVRRAQQLGVSIVSCPGSTFCLDPWYSTAYS
jgi:hypothetical protein